MFLIVRLEETSYAVVLMTNVLFALWNVGIDAFAIYGSRLSVHQVRLITKVDPMYVFTCYDQDQAGWQAHCDTERAFADRLVSRLTWPKAWGSDIDEVSETNRIKVVNDLVSQQLACVE